MRRSLLLLAAVPTLLAQPDRLGLPDCSHPSRELARRSAYLVCHDSSLKIPIWTLYELKPGDIATTALPRLAFRHDSALAGPAAFPSDYRHSGFSRGHLVPAADFAHSEESTRATYLLSNAVPMHQSLNAGRWRQLENAVRRLAANSDAVLVFTGPVLCPQMPRIGDGEVAVPCQLFKVILAIRAGRLEMHAVIFPNAPNPVQPLHEFAVPAAQVEALTGLDFFALLPAETQHSLESAASPLYQ